jgi:hypothetical protein
MPGAGLIGEYVATLSAQLPAPAVEELAGGLEETHLHYLRQGLDPDAAARAAIAEFGDPCVIIAAFARVNPARLAARRLLGAGPAVGACWAAALAAGRAWTWPVPVVVPVVAGLALLAVIGLLAAAARGTGYRRAARAAAAGCAGLTVLDAFVIAGVLLAAPAVTGMMIIAVAASGMRIAVSVRNLRAVLAG